MCKKIIHQLILKSEKQHVKKCQKDSKEHLTLNKKVKVHIGTIHTAFVEEDLIKVKGAVPGKKNESISIRNIAIS